MKLRMLPWVLGMLVVTSCFHEAGHGWMAFRMGDQSDYTRKRSNPFSFSHISLLFTIILPSAMMLFFGMMLGGAKPVMVRQAVGPWRMALVALAGPMANLFIGALSMGILAGLVHSGVLAPSMRLDEGYAFALQAVNLNFMLAALNLIPVPPFDGSRIVAALMPERMRQRYYSFSLPMIALMAGGFLLFYFSNREAFMKAYLKVLLMQHDGVMLIRHWIES